MYVVALHTIRNAQKFAELGKTIEKSIPAGIRTFLALPSTDHSQAICVWEGPSVQAVQSFLDRLSTGISDNRYFEVDQSQSAGLELLMSKKKVA